MFTIPVTKISQPASANSSVSMRKTSTRPGTSGLATSSASTSSSGGSSAGNAGVRAGMQSGGSSTLAPTRLPHAQPGQPPQPPPAPEVKGVMTGAALLCWPPLGQSVSRVILQAMAVKKAGATANFKKFSNKTGGCMAVVTVAADMVTSEVLSGLQPGTFYVYRLVISNAYGAVEGAPTEAIRTPHPDDPPAKESGSDDASTASKGSTRRRSSFFRRRKLAQKAAETARECRGSVGSADSGHGGTSTATSLDEGQSTTAPGHYDNFTQSSAPKDLAATDDDGNSGDGTSPDESPSESRHGSQARPPTPPQGRSAANRHARRATADSVLAVNEAPPAAVEEPTSLPSPSSPSSSAATTPIEDKAEEAETDKAVLAVPKSIAARLAIPVNVDAVVKEESKLEAQERRRREAAKLFKKADDASTAHSRIYQALNPGKLWYESRREKEQDENDADDSAEPSRRVLEVRGVSATAEVVRDYALPRDDDGNLAAPLAKDADAEGAGEEDAEEEEPVDPNNLPDFGEYQKEMEELRRKRAAAQEKRRKEMAEEFAAKKAEEKRRVAEELERIKAKEAAAKKAIEVTHDDVEAAQQRVAAEASKYLKFTFQG